MELMAMSEMLERINQLINLEKEKGNWCMFQRMKLERKIEIEMDTDIEYRGSIRVKRMKTTEEASRSHAHTLSYMLT